MKTQSAAYQAAMAKRIRPMSLLKVSVVSGGTTYTFREDSIVTASVVDEIDPLSRRLPTQTFSFTAADPTGEYDPANPTGKWLAFDKDAEVTVQFGLNLSGTETFLSADTYWLDGRPSSGRGTVTFQASGRLERLKGLYYLDPTSSSYNAAVTSILTAAGLSSSEYDIDSYELSRRIGSTTGFKPCTYAEALQYFAHASGMALYTRAGKVCMHRFINISPEPTYDPTITLGEIAFNGVTLKKEDTIGTLRKKSYAYKPLTGATETLFAGSIYLGSSSTTKTYHFEFEEPVFNLTITSTTATIDSQNEYTYAVDLTLTGSGNTYVTITGEYRERETNESVETIGTGATEEVLENPLLNFDSPTDLTAAWLVQDYEYYLPKRNTYAVTFRGSDAIEAGDSIKIETQNGTMCALVLGVRTEYNGAIATTLTVKAISFIQRFPMPGGGIVQSNDSMLIFSSEIPDTYEISVNGTLVLTQQVTAIITTIYNITSTLGLNVGLNTISIVAKKTGYEDSLPKVLTAQVQRITYNLTNATRYVTSPEKVLKGGSATLKIAANTGYELTDNISVTNATLTSWSKATGQASIIDVTGDVVFTATAVIPTGPNLKDSSGANVEDSDGEQIQTADAQPYQSAYTYTEMDAFITEVGG